MSIQFGIVMDDIATIKPYKDSSLAVLREVQRRQWTLYFMQQHDLYWQDNTVYATVYPLTVFDDNQHWFSLGEAQHMSLNQLDCIFMRKDPPFNMDYIYATYLLEQVHQQGTLVFNHPQALRDFNEKCSIMHFPQCIAPTCIAADMQTLKTFLTTHQDIVVKPLDGMGGKGIFRLQQHDPNINAVLETLTGSGQRPIMAQQYLPDITEKGDKRILLIDGKPIPHAIARFPAEGETRANLAAGGCGVGAELTKRDYWLCEQLAPALQVRGLVFVGVDVIGDYITEINVTSPTCICEFDAEFGVNVSGMLLDAMQNKLAGS